MGTTYYFQRSRAVQPQILKKLDLFSYTRDAIRALRRCGDRTLFQELPKEAACAAGYIGFKDMLDESRRSEVEERFNRLVRGMGGKI
jgi:hypothetical protein